MSLIIARKIQSARVFPPITPKLFDSRDHGNPDQKAAVTLLAFSERLTKWKKYFKGSRNKQDFLDRALLLHRNAFQSELAGRVQRADFFWEELAAELAGIFENDTGWLALAEALGAAHNHLEVLIDPATLRARFSEEVLIDTQAAFFNGYATHADPLTLESRAWKHLGYLKQLLNWTDWTANDKYHLIRESAETEITLLGEAQRWKEVTERGQHLIGYCPDSIDYKELLWTANLSERAKYFADNYGKREPENWLKVAIEDLENLRATYPLIVPIYEQLGRLYSQLAVSLAKKGHISHALLAAQKASTFSPSDYHADLLNELTQVMQQIQEEAEIHDFRGVRFKQTEAFLLDEVRVGFRLLKEYTDSDECRNMGKARQVACAMTLWQRVGLPKPPDRETERAGKLLAAIDAIFESSVPTLNEAIHKWYELSRKDTDLAEVEHQRVISFLTGHILKCEATPAQPENVATYVLEPATTTPVAQSGQPFDFWLFSRRDLRLKIQVVTAIVLLSVAGVLFVVDINARRVRAVAYQSIIEGSQTRNHLQVIEGAEAFLSHPLIATTDVREEEVIERYNKSLVLWVARQPAEINVEVTARVERYRQLVGHHRGGDL